MNTVLCRDAIAPAIAALGASMLHSGQTVAQIDTPEWLFPQRGFWSDPSNWSDSNVPDTLSEIARLSPTPELVGGELTLSDFNAWVFQYNRPCGR
ncbi:MAG: hypothetical protein ED559_13420 [Phycisphaera sp.]|nr:MAG: hypothetical protein ED559_13420 [Phycisphaera sp.]